MNEKSPESDFKNDTIVKIKTFTTHLDQFGGKWMKNVPKNRHFDTMVIRFLFSWFKNWPHRENKKF